MPVIAQTTLLPFAVFYMQQPLKLYYLWAAGCVCGAVYLIFRP
ncbi:MAG: DMT family protein [Chthoniobacter sp.]|nr:DMT family protein [Chthoniobacter sp.]